MTKIIDGVIKFDFSKFSISGPLADELYQPIEKYRILLFKKNLIGEYPVEKVGFGNLSRRINVNEFVITGTQTGHLEHLNSNHYALVSSCDLAKNQVCGSGPIKPSSEALTHYALYSSAPHINYIFHIHHPITWKYMIDHDFPSTDENVEYGTLEMADQAKAIINKLPIGSFVMKGHQDGVVSYGVTAEEAFFEIMKVYNLAMSSSN